MPPLRRLRRITTALLLGVSLPTLAADTVPDAAWILSRLAQPAPMRTQFVEVRGSALLKTPMRISGEYRRPDNDTLVREVRSPYAETVTLKNGQVTLQRGSSRRTFSMARAPQLAGLQQGFGALLRGDRAGLERDFTTQVSGTRSNWRMVLAPRNPQLARDIRDITLYGRGAELRCTETRLVRGAEVQRTLLASAAATTATTAQALADVCHAAR